MINIDFILYSPLLSQLIIYPILMASAGCCTCGFLLDWTKARAKERLPILPQYIKRMMTHRETGCSALVIPVVIPTVPIAENVSNKISENPRG